MLIYTPISQYDKMHNICVIYVLAILIKLINVVILIYMFHMFATKISGA